MNKLVFVVQVSILKWPHLVHRRCLLIKSYINILSVGPFGLTLSPGLTNLWRQIITSIAIIQSLLTIVPTCRPSPHPHQVFLRCPGCVSQAQWEVCTCSPPWAQVLPRCWHFLRDAIPKPHSCSHALPRLPNLQNTPAAKGGIPCSPHWSEPCWLSNKKPWGPLTPEPCPTLFPGP